MVKNTTGGTGTKSLARKNEKSSASSRIILAEDELEHYGCVTKLFGNGMCEVTMNDDKKLIGHIRKKFRGKQKRHNLISLFSIVLIGMRDWESPAKNCDILTIYEEMQVEQLKCIPSININHLIHLRTSGSFCKGAAEADIVFAMDDDDSTGNIKMGASAGGGGAVSNEEAFELEQTAEINIDEI
jgi:initiation factor 1A